MRKTIAIVLTLVLALSMSLGALAAEVSVPGSGSTDINAEYQKEAPTVKHKYYVTIEWGFEGKLTYTVEKDTYSWNTDKLTYDKQLVTDGTWTVENGTRVTVKVSNYSDLPVKATCQDPVPADGLTITGNYDKQSFTVASAATNGLDTVTGTVQTGETAYNITAMAGAIATSGSIGTLTVKIETVEG